MICPMEWPLPEGLGTVYCDYSCHLSRKSNAPGLDISAPLYTPVLACAAGKVLRSRATERAGRSLWLDHGQGSRGFYSHLAVALALEGEWVEQGQIIGLVGRTGFSTTRPHLHISFKFLKEWIDPARLLRVPE